MKLAIIVAALFPFLLASAFAADGCPNTYIRRTDSAQKQSDLYLIQVPKGFSPDKADIKATYLSISSRQNPTHHCVFNSHSHGQGYQEGACKNLVTGRQTSVFGGDGIRISEDGNTTLVHGYDARGPWLEDSNKNRILVGPFNDIASDLNYSRYLISDCHTGMIEGINFRDAFPGYIILERATEKGFVNTYQSAPNIKF